MQSIQLGTDTQTHTPVYLPENERTYHTVIIGQTRFGKTALLERMVIEDLKNDINAVLFDPHGDLTEDVLLQAASAQKADKVMLYEIAADSSYVFNPVEVKNNNDPMEVSRTVDSLMQVFRKHWTTYAWGPRVEWVLSNCIRTLVANPGHTLDEIPLLLRDDAFRSQFLPNITNPQVHEFWRWYRTLESTRRPQDEWQLIESTLTRLSQFLANEWLVRILYQPTSTVDFDKIINNTAGQLTIFSLPIGRLGEEPAALLGSLLLGKLATAIFGRIDYGAALPRLHIYIDELSRFSLPITARLWTEGGKYNIGLTATLQTLSQLQDEENKSAVLQAGNHICFQCIGTDAQVLSQQMPLPDPASLMKPEAMLLYSSHAIEDILARGHPNKFIQLVGRYYFWMFDELQENKNQGWVEYPFFQHISPDDSWYEKLPHWFLSGWRTRRQDVQEAERYLNEYLLRSMQHEFYQEKTWFEQVKLLVKIITLLEGVLGIHKAYKQEQQEDWKNYLQTKSEGTRMLISPREQEQLYTWTLSEDADALNRQFVDVINASSALLGRKIDAETGEILGRWVEAKATFYQTLREIQYELAIKPDTYQIAYWEGKHLYSFATNISYCGYLLEKEPIYIPSRSYRDVEYSRRTFADVRDELAQRLVSLPRYEAIAALVSEGKTAHIKTLPLPSLASSAQTGAQMIRTRSRQQVNKPMQEIMDTLKKRNQSKSQGNLPPPKTHI